MELRCCACLAELSRLCPGAEFDGGVLSFGVRGVWSSGVVLVRLRISDLGAIYWVRDVILFLWSSRCLESWS